MKLSYKIWDVEKLLHALEDQDIVPINTDVLYAGNEQSEEQEQELLIAEKEIERVQNRIHAAGHKRKRPSSKSSLIVGYGEGRATREIELIWGPNLYALTEHGQMVLRMYIEKFNF